MMAYMNSDNDDDDASSSCSDTTLGETSVDLLLGLRQARRSQEVQPQRKSPPNATSAPAPAPAHAHAHASVASTYTHTDTGNIRNVDSSSSSSTNISQSKSPPKNKQQQQSKQSASAPVTSPPTQTLNELSQLLTSSEGEGMDRVGDTDLMFDMSQLSQISFPDHNDNGIAIAIAGTGNDIPTNERPTETFMDIAGTGKTRTSTTTGKGKGKGATSTRTCTPSTGKESQKETSGIIDDDAPSTLHYITLPRNARFGMNISQTQNMNKTKTYCCVTNVYSGSQAECYGVQKGDLIYHPPKVPDRKTDLDHVIQEVRKNLKPVGVDEVVEWSKSLQVRPVTIVVERLVKDGNESSKKCSISNDEIHRALMGGARKGYGYPKMPCCRKCKYPSLAIRSHHCLCSMHKNFKDSGAKEKLVILLAGALYGCEACICEIESGKKNPKLLHSFKCQITSKTARDASSGALVAEKASASASASGGKSTASKSKSKESRSTGGKGASISKKSRSSAPGPTSSNVAKKATNKRKVSSEVSKAAPRSKKSKSAKAPMENESPPTRSVDFVAMSASTPRTERKKDDEAMFNGGDKDRQTSIIGETSAHSITRRAQVTRAEQRESQHTSVPVTPALKAPPIQQDSTHRGGNPSLTLTDEASVSKWVPCTNPWGDRDHCDGDFVLFSPEDYESALEIYGPNPKRFVADPFETKSMTYSRTHVSQEDGGFRVLQLSRDRLALRSWGFNFCCHDFGGACLVTDVEPMSPADAAVLVSSGAKHAPLRPNDMIICVNNKNVGGMTEVDLGVELDMSGSQLSLIVSRYKMPSKPYSPSWVDVDAAENLHWNEIGEKNTHEMSKNETGNDLEESPLMSEIDSVSSPTEGEANVAAEIPITSENMELCDRDRNVQSEISRMNLVDLPCDIVPMESDRNKSGYCGIVMYRSNWRARISLPWKEEPLVIGDFDSQIDAARMYAWAFSILGGHDALKEMHEVHDVDGGEIKQADIQNESSLDVGSKINQGVDVEDIISCLDIKNLPNEIEPIKCSASRSGFRGLIRLSDKRMWKVDILVNNRMFHLGVFQSKIEGSKMYAWAYRIVHGEEALQELRSHSQKSIREKISLLDIKDLPATIRPIKEIRAKSGYRGSCCRTANVNTPGRWVSVIHASRKRLQIGSFDSNVEAGKMYAWAYQTIFGEEALEELQLEEDDEEDPINSARSDNDEIEENDMKSVGSDQIEYARADQITNEMDESSKSEENTGRLLTMPCKSKVLPNQAKKTHPADVGSSDGEEPEWDDDSNPWLGCICGDTHESPTPVFWVQCDSCDAWYNCSSACVGFSKQEATKRNDWECPGCAPFDADAVPKKYSSIDMITPARAKSAHEYEELGHEKEPIPIGTIVDVEDRTWSGSYKYGGVAKVCGFNVGDGIFYDVRYVLDNRVETNLDFKYVSVNLALMTNFASPRSTRSTERK